MFHPKGNLISLGIQANSSWLEGVDTAVKTYVTDHLGSVVNSTLTSTAKSYASFGELLQTAPTASSTQPGVTYGYAGREIELESPCLYYNRWRHYDSCSGRFMSEDPIGLEGGDTNLYRYVNNSPLDSLDPTGECKAVDWVNEYRQSFRLF